MRFPKSTLIVAAALGASACVAQQTESSPPGPAVLLVEDFNQEGDGRYRLNFTNFERWVVTRGSVDVVGTAPFDDFLPASQGMYVDLDGTSQAAGTLQSRKAFPLPPGRYELAFKMSGTPRPRQPDNTMIVSLGTVFRDTITLQSYAPLQVYSRIITVRRGTSGHLRFEHLGGDDYGIFIDDIQLRRL